MDLKRPTRESNEAGHFSSPIWSCSGRGLPCVPCYQRTGGLLPHLFTLIRQRADGIFSVALSVGSLLPHVMRRPALWSSDFPHPSFDGRDRLPYFGMMKPTLQRFSNFRSYHAAFRAVTVTGFSERSLVTTKIRPHTSQLMIRSILRTSSTVWAGMVA